MQEHQKQQPIKEGLHKKGNGPDTVIAKCPVQSPQPGALLNLQNAIAACCGICGGSTTTAGIADPGIPPFDSTLTMHWPVLIYYGEDTSSEGFTVLRLAKAATVCA